MDEAAAQQLPGPQEALLRKSLRVVEATREGDPFGIAVETLSRDAVSSRTWNCSVV